MDHGTSMQCGGSPCLSSWSMTGGIPSRHRRFTGVTSMTTGWCKGVPPHSKQWPKCDVFSTGLKKNRPGFFFSNSCSMLNTIMLYPESSVLEYISRCARFASCNPRRCLPSNLGSHHGLVSFRWLTLIFPMKVVFFRKLKTVNPEVRKLRHGIGNHAMKLEI